jgi:hypothetical protein
MKQRLQPLDHCFLATAVLLFVSAVGPASLWAQGASTLRIESWTRRVDGVELNLATQWGSRYRVESSTNLLNWSTNLVTDGARGSSLTVLVKETPAPARFYRVALCDSEELRANLQAARQLWLERSCLNYDFDFRWQCSCTPDFTSWVRVKVRDRAIQELTYLSTGEAVPAERWKDYVTVEGLFDWILSRLDQHPDHIEAEFDPAWGIPVSGFVDYSVLIADDEIRFQLVGFTKVN